MRGNDNVNGMRGVESVLSIIRLAITTSLTHKVKPKMINTKCLQCKSVDVKQKQTLE